MVGAWFFFIWQWSGNICTVYFNWWPVWCPLKNITQPMSVSWPRPWGKLCKWMSEQREHCEVLWTLYKQPFTILTLVNQRSPDWITGQKAVASLLSAGWDFLVCWIVATLQLVPRFIFDRLKYSEMYEKLHSNINPPAALQDAVSISPVVEPHCRLPF